ncbi:hypothetical protein EDB84DRAFT_160263 [Lactarius hengduanensis]|nr:hypothetical protein EDB84DRAFT_160263 [Lactarius hengduanensis]
MRRPPQPQLQQTSTCSLARPTSPAPFCRQMDRTLSTTGGRNTGGDAGLRHLPLRCCSTTRRCRQASCGGMWSTSPARWRRTRGVASRRRWARTRGAAMRSPLEGTQNVWRYVAIAFLVMLLSFSSHERQWDMGVSVVTNQLLFPTIECGSRRFQPLVTWQNVDALPVAYRAIINLKHVTLHFTSPNENPWITVAVLLSY